MLLVSLGLAALSGLCILFLPTSSAIIGRLVGTAILTALASSFVLLALKALESPQYKVFGMSMGGLVCFIYVCAVSAIWLDALRFSNVSEKLAGTALLALGCGAVALVGTARFSNAKLSLAGKVLAGLWSVLLLCWLVELWFTGSIFSGKSTWEFILVPLQFYSIVFTLILIHPSWYYRIFSLAVAVLSCVCIQIGLILTNGHLEEMETLLIAILFSAWLSGVLAIWNVITYRPKEHTMVWSERGTAVLVGVALASFCGLVWYNILFDSQRFTPELLVRISTGFGILAPTALVALIIGRKIRTNAFLHSESNSLNSFCPRCTEPIVVPAGKSACQNCGLAMSLKIASAGCRACNYDLSGSIESGLCPECGEPIPLMNTLL